MPRATVHTDLFEIVAVKADGQLLVFLDDYVGNTPVTGAEVEVMADSDLGLLREVAPGIYAADWSPAPGAIDITVLVAAGARSDLLLATIDVPDTGGPVPLASRLGSFSEALSVSQMLAAFLLGGIVTYLLLQRRRRPASPAAADAGSDVSRAVAPDAVPAAEAPTEADGGFSPDRTENDWTPRLARTAR